MRTRSREKSVRTRIDKDMKDRVVESGIDRVPVRFPATIREIELDVPANHFVVVDPNRRSLEIRPSLAVPCSELDDLNGFAADAPEVAAEIAGKPAGLELQFIRIARGRKERALADASALAQLAVAIRGGRGNHAANP